VGHQSAAEHQRFGEYLRRIREQRKLSLDAVEELSTGFTERVTKSHLSRIENGRAVPTFPRMFTLSQIYGVPVTSLAERFELELWRQTTPADAGTLDDRAVIERAFELEKSGEYVVLLSLVTAVLERRDRPDRPVSVIASLRRFHVNALLHLERYESAKAECEKLLGLEELEPRDRVLALLAFVICCYRLRRYTIARMGLEETERCLGALGEEPTLWAKLETNRAAISAALGQWSEAAAMYDRATTLHEAVPDPHEACRARTNLGQSLIELGQWERAKDVLREALRSAEERGYDRLAALAHSHLGLVSFKARALDTAESAFLRSNALARPRQYITLVFRNCYYLWLIAGERGDAAAVKTNERSLKTYLSRISGELSEAEAFRSHLAGDNQ
jgi:tetratricopeptide (TPR) repeat protein